MPSGHKKITDFRKSFVLKNYDNSSGILAHVTDRFPETIDCE